MNSLRHLKEMKLEGFTAQFNGTGRRVLVDACPVPSAMRSSIGVKSWFYPSPSSILDLSCVPNL